MTKIAENLEKIIQQDPGNRGLSHWAVKNHLQPAVSSLNEGRHILMASGFYILKAGAIETDGPPGALILADALVRSGKKVTLLFDSHSEDIFTAGLAHVSSDIEFFALPIDQKVTSSSFIKEDTTHMIALERPGKASDGKCHNSAGLNITPHHASLDELFTLCQDQSITTIGVGDGGNELGMGLLSDRVNQFSRNDFSCRTSSDFCICSGVSNWGGYAMAALLSFINRENLMVPPIVHYEIIRDIVKAGAVDGISGKQEMTVDGLELSWEESIYEYTFKTAQEGKIYS